MATHNLVNVVISDIGQTDGVILSSGLVHKVAYITNSFSISNTVIADLGRGGSGEGGDPRPTSGFIYPRGIC